MSLASEPIPINNELNTITGINSNIYSKDVNVIKNLPMTFSIINWPYKGYSYYNLSEIEWDFGDGSNSSEEYPTHIYTESGDYIVIANITYEYHNITFNVLEGMLIHVFLSEPIPSLEVYQEINITLIVTGRKDNTVGIRIYEDGILIQSNEVMRTAGPSNSISIMLNKYLDRIYEIDLVYDADHKGVNPAWLNFTSGENFMTFFNGFNTKDGFSQIVLVPTSYLVNIVENNPTYRFDASGSYDLDGEIVSYMWDFGDNSTSEGILVEHTYAMPGLYMVNLTVIDDDRAIAKEILEVEVC